ncbi:MAG: LysE family translocator [Rhodospirillales bacterium]|nr:LysE family translocator [Rhodospirillales bacterium]
MDAIALYLPGILIAYSICLVGLASPGPNILSIIGTSMHEGRKPGVALAMGVASGSCCWAVLTVTGLSAILAAYAWALTFIKIAGGFYLLWLAYKSFKSAADKHEIQTRVVDVENARTITYYLRGLTIQMTNPKAALSWIAIISLGLQPGAPMWVAATIVIGTFMISSTLHIMYALAFSTETMVRLYSKARRTIQATLGVFFTLAGLKLLTSRT